MKSAARHLAQALAVAACVVAAACTSTGGGGGPTPTASPSPFPSSAQPSTPGSPTPTPTQTSGALNPVSDPGQVTGTLHGPCHTRDGGNLPDPVCTPGSYDPKITAAILCAPGYTTRTYRAPESETTKFKYQVAEPAYGQVNVTGELDHLVSLELGGSNDATNLWVEAGPIPNSKDSVENALHDWVCANGGSQARLIKAQIAIATNWETAKQILGIK